MRIQLTVGPLKIRGFVTHRRRALEDGLNARLLQTFDGHAQAQPIPLNFWVKVIGDHEQLCWICGAVGKAIDVVCWRVIYAVLLSQCRLPKFRLNQMKNVGMFGFHHLITLACCTDHG